MLSDYEPVTVTLSMAVTHSELPDTDNRLAD